jgi:hypothetical protein
MTKYVVEKLRISYSSGKYDRLELLLAYKDIVNGEDIPAILDYLVFPELKLELKQRIIEVPLAQEVYEEYQNTLRALVNKAEAMELSGNKHFPFAESKALAMEIAKSKLSGLTTITFEDLRGMYLKDEGILG